MSDLDDFEWFHPLAKAIVERLRLVPERSPDNPVLMDLTVVHGKCGTGTGLCDDGGHAGDDGCFVLTRIASHLGIKAGAVTLRAR